MKQTAVEWLINYFSTYVDMSKHDIEIQQAKEMEKQQMMDAFDEGSDDGFYGFGDSNKEKYYNETYGSKGSDETKIEKIPINLTSTQIIELAEIGKEFIYEGANGDTRLSSGGIIKIIQKYNEMTSSQTEISVDKIDKAAKQYYEENIDCSNIPRNHYEWEIQELMSDFCYKWYREQLKSKGNG